MWLPQVGVTTSRRLMPIACRAAPTRTAPETPARFDRARKSRKVLVLLRVRAPPSAGTGATDGSEALWYPPRSTADPWCSGPTCQPVTLEIAGSNPVGSAIVLLLPHAPSARPDGAFHVARQRP